jgi:hypothetical protein
MAVSNGTARPKLTMAVGPSENAGLVGLAAVLFYFLYFANFGLFAEFTHDDLLNSFQAWRRSWPDLILDNLLFFRFTPTYRPLPGVMYKASFALFDFWTMPMRIVCYSLLVGNSVLIYLVAKRMTKSVVTGLIASLLIAYHPKFSFLYQSNGFCYDIFCFFFYFLALYCYLRKWNALFLIFFIAALNSKEMAVSLPAAILFWELLWNPPRTWKWLWQEGKWATITGLIAVTYIVGRMAMPPTGLLRIGGGYGVEFSFAEYTRHLASYFNRIFSTVVFDPGLAIGAALALVVLAVLLKDRVMVWAWACFVVGVLPVAFITQRELDSIYVPLGAFAIYGGQGVYRILSAVLSRFEKHSDFVWNPAAVWICFGMLVLLLCRAYRVPPPTQGYKGEYAAIRETRENLATALSTIPSGARLYVKNEPYPAKVPWSSLFLVRLQRRNDSITVDNPVRVPNADQSKYDWILDWDKYAKKWKVERGRK